MADDEITGPGGGKLLGRVRKFATNGLTRRTFLVLGGTAAAGAIVDNALNASDIVPDVAPQDNIFGLPDYIATLRRPEDQCLLTFGFYNLRPDFANFIPVLTVINSDEQSYMSVVFGGLDASAPQHVAEEAFPLKQGNLQPQSNAPTPPPTTNTIKAPPIDARVAGTSRLVFHVPNSAVAPASDDPILFVADDLLNWLALHLSVVRNALPPVTADQVFFHPPAGGVGPPEAPLATQTSIELPYGLVLSPPASPVYGEVVGGLIPSTVFVNATKPVTHGNWTELWHTRLAARVLKFFGNLGALVLDETDREVRTVRAVWCPDPGFAADVADNAVEPSPIPDRPPFKTNALRYPDRYDIVRLSSDFTNSAPPNHGVPGGGPFMRVGVNDRGQAITSPFVPTPAKVTNLMLSSLGGWLDCSAQWDLPHSTHGGDYNSSLLSWRHRAVQGRDSYVRVVRKGYLFPWGHRASLVTVTERQPTSDGSHVGAYLRQKTFIVVTDPEKSYGGANDFDPHSGRWLPYTDVEILTLVTPDLDPPHHFLPLSHQFNNNEIVFQPTIGGDAFDFHLRGTDWAGDLIDFRSPVLWIDDTRAYGDGTTNQDFMDEVIANWKTSSPTGGFPTIDMKGHRVSVAVPKNPKAAVGDTQLVLASVALSVVNPKTGTSAQDLVNAGQPAYSPALHSLTIKLPQAAALAGKNIADSEMVFDPQYLGGGFDGNKGGIFLRRLNPTGNPIGFNGANSGGSVTPNLTLDGYSREIGPASGDVDQLTLGTYDPTQVFSSVDAKLLGGLELSTILGLVHFGDTTTDPDNPTSDNAQALQITTVERFNPHRLVTTMDWHPVVIDGGPTLANQVIQIFEVKDPDGQYPNSSDPHADPVDGSSTIMDLHAVIVTDLDDPTNSTTIVTGQIRDFNLNLFGTADGSFFIQVPFDSLTFRAQSGRKTDVDVQVSGTGVAFQGALSFVQDLASYLNFAGSGLTVDTSGDAITATLTLAIPSIGIGVFALENIAFNAGVAIPYNGDPVRFDFDFCSAENPFQLEIMIFTGGGYVGIGVGVDGVERLEFGFDFGFGLSLDIGIASGQVSLTGGVSYECNQTEDGGQEVDLSAYVKASGGISALGLVSVSVEMSLTLEYQSDDTSSQLAGDAEMSISVHIIFFGFSVGFDVHEEFAGSGPDSFMGQRFAAPALESATATASGSPPKPNSFGISMAQSDWDRYCTSFALLGV